MKSGSPVRGDTPALALARTDRSDFTFLIVTGQMIPPTCWKTPASTHQRYSSMIISIPAPFRTRKIHGQKRFKRRRGSLNLPPCLQIPAG